MAIRVDGLGKQYRLGGSRESYSTLRDQFRKWTSLRGLLRRANRTEHNPPFWALKDVSFEVKQGEVIGIIGRNGAGKSTLLKILSRITEPTEGGADIQGRVGSLLEVGTGFHPELTGRENVYLNGAIMGMKRAEIIRKFDEIVAFAEVENFIDTPVKHYSSGMYMRLAFAVAAHLDPEILIVDEVLAVGDAAFQKRCLGKMSEIAKGGRTVLFVSHNMAAIQQFCTRSILLRAGELSMHGRVETVLNEYLRDALDNESGVFNVASHPARQRSHSPTIMFITLAGQDGDGRTIFHPQDGLIVSLHLSLPRLIREPVIAVAIEDHLGRRITTVANYFSSGTFPALTGEAIVRCTVPRIGLGPGRYLISASIGERHSSLIDSIDGVAWFTIEWDNNYGNGESYNPVYGPVLYPSSWYVDALEEKNG
jgi:lipopolysaccharide transport system ATP-binding protein